MTLVKRSYIIFKISPALRLEASTLRQIALFSLVLSIFLFELVLIFVSLS